MAETEGFEPSVQMYPYDGLANRWFQPLTHVSGSQRRGRAIAAGFGVGKRRAEGSGGQRANFGSSQNGLGSSPVHCGAGSDGFSWRTSASRQGSPGAVQGRENGP